MSRDAGIGILLESGAEVGALDKYGRTALRLAFLMRNHSIEDMLHFRAEHIEADRVD
jgi:ankyrin repeat protein